MTNFEKIWQCLNNYDFEINLQSIIHLKCTLCNGLLKDAYEGQCGCNYCKICLEKYKSEGGKFCPGKDCQLEKVSIENNIYKSNSANKNVSKLIIKCPLQCCDYEDELIKLCDHLDNCVKRELCCPYNKIGCQTDKINGNLLNNHLEINFKKHNQLLIDYLINLKNEVTFMILNNQSVTENELNNLFQSINLKIFETIHDKTEELFKKQEIIDQLKEEIKELKNKVEELSKSIKEIKLNCNGKMIDFKVTQEKELGIFKDSFHSEMNKMQMDLENHFKNSKEIQQGSSNYSNEPPNIIQEINLIKSIENPMIKFAYFVWKIPDISGVRKKSGTFSGEYFNSMNNEYQMWLNLYPSGFGNKTHLSVEFRIKKGIKTDKSFWPFICSITMIIQDKFNTKASHNHKKQCTFQEPELYWGSEFFHFLYSDLEGIGVFRHNSILIECIIEINK